METDQSADQVALKAQMLEQGHHAFDNDDYARALDFYHRACLMDPKDSDTWTAVAMAFNNLEFPREAWRSYLLALHFNPGNNDALWYASEFLAQMEDLPLAGALLEQYLRREQDEERLAAARELYTQVRSEAQQRGIDLDGDRGAAAQDLLSQMNETDAQAAEAQLSSGPAGEQSQTSEEVALSEEDFQLSDEELEREALSAANFIAPLQLRLTGFEGLCRHCGLQIPADAPYCWSCKMIHFYD